MYPTNNEDTLNKNTVEPTLYYAEYPSIEQQQRYLFQAALSALFVTMLVLIAFGVS
ncbi:MULTISPECIES: photosystem II assembly protein Psb34 [Aerosakkonema]|uniref:photosystem II assembly protein Psb34 n=1 Tax=Aerosakkonema TaxID=1246629 RepID=UPI0035B950D6